MTWIKLDDGFFMHPKALAAGRDGRDVYLAALCWSAAQETDGVIPALALPVIAMIAGVTDTDQAASRLVEVGLWITHVDGWAIHGFGDWQTTRSDRDTWRAKERGRKETARKTATSTEKQTSVRADSARIPRGFRAIDVDVDVDVSSSEPSYSQAERQTDDDDDLPNIALSAVAQALAQRNGARTPAYAAVIIRQAEQLPALRALADRHPADTAEQLARRYLDDPTPPPAPPPRCDHCNATTHHTGDCPAR